MKIKLCDIIIEIKTIHNNTNNICKEYEYYGAEAPAFCVYTSQEDIDRERRISENTDIKEGRIIISHSDGVLETTAIYRKIAQELATRGIILFHGSTVEIDGKGYIFAAPSGTGKSTFSHNLKLLLGDKMQYINDDKPLIKADEYSVLVYGTPWDGKHHLSSNKNVELDSIYIVERSINPWIEEVTFKEVFSEIFMQTYKPSDPSQMNAVLRTLDFLSRNVKFYRMGITYDSHTAELFVKRYISSHS